MTGYFTANLTAFALGAVEKGWCHTDPTKDALTAETGHLPARRRKQTELH